MCDCQFEEAVRWIENEVHKNGVFEIKQSMADSYDHKTKITSSVPTGRFDGFTVSSQHVKDRHNLLQLVMEMKRKEKERAENPPDEAALIKYLLSKNKISR